MKSVRFSFLCGALLLASCTKDNPNVNSCEPRSVQNCACPGGVSSVQQCRDDGMGYGPCLACPEVDMAVPPGSDLSVNPGDDLSVNPGDDFSVNPDDDFATNPGDDLSLPPKNDLAQPPGSCPRVMFLLDTSGSMMDPWLDPNTSGTHIDAAKSAMNYILDHYGSRFPIGFTTFTSNATTDAMCVEGTVIHDEPAIGSATIRNDISAAQPNGTTPTGDAVAAVGADPNMGAGGYIILLTDGDPNCRQGTSSMPAEPNDTTIKISRVRGQGIITYVVLMDPEDTQTVHSAWLNNMAGAGGAPCSGGFCEGNKFYPARSTERLQRAVDLVMNDIVQRAGGKCGGFACFPSGAACSSSKTCCGTTGCDTLSSDADNCGSCGVVCPSRQCIGGKCTTPPGDMATPPDMGAKPLCKCATTCAVISGDQCVGPNCCLSGTIFGSCTASDACTPN